ncbi:MAG: MBL fold metallo-hydrolase [Firmicutes bacterium HGW-Firmicutes-12]|nr:MAG: MBL fold metallo-hydrolase [Firmicutes bacterium HGW-Firmicutes-12]
MKATVICENSVFRCRGAIAEHGWSVFLETPEGNYLLDTGQGQAIINNARILNIDLDSIRGIILSHHHYDHTGGLFAVLENIKRKIPVYVHADLFKESFFQRQGQVKHIGIPHNRLLLETMGAEFVFNKEVQEIIPGVFMTGEVPRITTYEKGDKDLVIRVGNGFIADTVLDDQSLVIKTQQGLFIILGCAHSGIINTIEYALKITGEERIHTIIGGTHLGPVSEEQKAESIKALKEYSIARLGVSHCTGLLASARLSQEFGERFFYCNVGTVVEV